ncbi:hypothetical protein SteCoe_22921 [Stentor coeruleus]|uniref:Uncharacterized protein n=1 Tax=Stentor coeruleus TaxID=5963 RepID=A0A1R2BL58_9CILI|nr:hypothetical protein SteCoe_22921 [Stentor coeruleus]
MKCSNSQCKKVPTIRCKCNSNTNLLFCFTHFQNHYDTCGKLPDAISKNVIDRSKSLDAKITSLEEKIVEKTQTVIRSIELLSINILGELQAIRDSLSCTTEKEIDDTYENVKEICRNFQLDCLRNSYFFDDSMDVLLSLRREDIGMTLVEKKKEYLDFYRYDTKGIEDIKEITMTSDEAFVFICEI